MVGQGLSLGHPQGQHHVLRESTQGTVLHARQTRPHNLYRDVALNMGRWDMSSRWGVMTRSVKS